MPEPSQRKQRKTKQRRVGGMDLQGEGVAWIHEICEDKKATMRETTDEEKQKRTKEEKTRKNAREKERNIPEHKEPKQKVIKCFYANARSIINRTKRMELELYVEEEGPDIIGLTETWAKEEMEDCELQIDGYVMFRKDRENQKTTGHGAGGVVLYVKSDIVAIERQDLSNNK